MLNGTASTGQAFLANGGGQYPANAFGDFDGDQKTDIAGGTGATIRVTLLNGTASAGQGFLGTGGGTLLGQSGDANGDGKDDLFFNGASATRINLMNGTTSASQGFVGNGGVPVTHTRRLQR